MDKKLYSQNSLSEQWDVNRQVYSGGCEEAVNEFLETNIDIIGGAKTCIEMNLNFWRKK